ncbi:MAG TPA: type II secretion system protein, partial [Candidatus Paceibacterota bacterium]|nr:type II secretion system protein [Candidatus Paceibacterota bacterium]
MKTTKKRKAFTLIELLVVIAIIAVLSVVVILSLNPAELLRQSRDSNRISDMATLKSAISLYLADVASPFIGTSTVCDVSIVISTPTSSNGPYVPQTNGTWTIAVPTSTCGTWMANEAAGTAGVATVTAANARNINGTGWIPVNFTLISSGAPLGNEPIDPTNVTGTAANRGSGAFFYSYMPNTASTSFKMAALTESNKYSTLGSND